jgi:nitroimidazol reductase NimA-like FMN-containing flavoprotein (pyridoxamine 5'-phosphate oxidase superfamily)
METEHRNLKELTPQEVTNLLRRGSHAHLGCYRRGEVYVVPVTYVYEGDFLYSHSPAGKKIEMMRSNKKVCLQVEDVRSLFEWQSVIVWGKYQELKGGMEAEMGLRLLKERIAQLERDRGLTPLEIQISAILSKAVIYRIKIEKVTGRAESAANRAT